MSCLEPQMRIVARSHMVVALALVVGAFPVRAQLTMETVVGDPRVALEKDWGPLPLPPGATYEAECSRVRRTAIFFLGFKFDSAALRRAQAHAKAEKAKLDADTEAGRSVSLERVVATMALAVGTAESRALVDSTVSFLKARGMIVVEDGLLPLLQFPATSEKVRRLDYTLAASVEGTGVEGIAVCPSAGGPTLEFGKR